MCTHVVRSAVQALHSCSASAALIFTIRDSSEISMSVLTLRSWASSMIMTEYASSRQSDSISLSRIPSVINYP